MPRETEVARVKRWRDRVSAANKVYDKWEEEYQCAVLARYYRGKQWQGVPEEDANRYYVINLIFPTIEMQLPSLMFYHPQVKVEPRPAHADDLNSNAAGRSTLIEDTLQTFIDDPKLHFKTHTLLALRDAPFRFGVVEVGYTADWIDNPNAGKPVLRESDDPMQDEAGEPVTQPAKVLKGESLFLKRIDPRSFRVSLSGHNITEENDWSGYFEWHYVEDLKRNPRYKNTANLRAGGVLRDMPQSNVSDDPDHDKHIGMVKVWKIWDHRRKVKHVFADGHDKFLLENEPAPYLPFATLKFYEIADEWYPLPPVYNWRGPQDEINETREQQRRHRQKFTRRYTVTQGKITDGEMEKLETGADGAWAYVQEQGHIQPVPDADISPSNSDAELARSKDDFYQITGVAGEQRGVPDADTATQANIINIHAQIRESQLRVLVADWLSSICRLMLLTIREHMQLPMWIKSNVDLNSSDPESLARTVKNWQELKASDLGAIDVDVKVDIASLSPVSEDSLRNAWNQVLALLTNPSLLMVLMQPNPQSPNEPSPLLRKTLGFYGIKSDKEVREIARVGALALQMIMMQAMAQAGGAGGGTGGAGAGLFGAMPETAQPNPGSPATGPIIQ